MALSFGIQHQRVRMRTAAGLHRGDLLGVLDVGDVENSHAAETVLLRDWHPALLFVAWGRRRLGRKTLIAAIEASIRHFYRHEQQIFVNRNIALAAWANQRGQQCGLRRIGNVIDADPVKISLKKMIALECEVGVRECELRDYHLQRFRDFRHVTTDA